MSDYRRYFLPGGTYFFTIVTYDRRPILTTPAGRQSLREAITKIRSKRPFSLVATVVLPDHWHLIMQLPACDDAYSIRLKQIKEEFTRSWLSIVGSEANTTVSQQKRGERGIWQPRFWEHLIEDENDCESCVDYIHWNPRKHGLVRRVRDWPWSSFHRFARSGQYGLDWGGTEPASIAGRVSRHWAE